VPTAAAARRDRLAEALEPLYAAYNRECSTADPVEHSRLYAA
jgi:hypothetical protein